MIWSFLLEIPVEHLDGYALAEREMERQKLIEMIIGFTITAMIMSVPTYWLIRYTCSKIKREFRFKTKFNQYNHVDALILLSMNVLRTHPDCFREKCAYLKEYIVYLYPENDSFHESIKMAYEDVYHSESIVRWLNRFQDADQRRNTVRFLIHMAAQDGVIAHREEAELFRIIDSFELTRPEWAELIANINQEFANRQNRWRKTNPKAESYSEDIQDRALIYFEVKRESIDEQLLREKYRRLVKEYHPDRHPDATPEERKEFELKFQELQLYYEELLKLLQ
ncbi:DnaJ domain-containing protein [Fluviicola sp.]|uniref:DnaJ domain-containing protein n=1 Tax=Fluviicola sp. TaxID=1917219 RepID=UPI0031DAD6BF